MSETLSAVLPFGFDIMDLNRIEAAVHVENTRSIGPLGRFGFVQEGLLKRYKHYMDSLHDFYLFSLLKSYS